MRRPIAILLCACLITVMVPQAYPQGLQQATTSLPPLLADEWSEQRGPLARSELGLAFLFWKGLAALRDCK